MPELEEALREVAAEMAERTDRGDVASYIPQLGKIDSKKFGIAAVTNDVAC
jgi:glutaminase